MADDILPLLHIFVWTLYIVRVKQTLSADFQMWGVQIKKIKIKITKNMSKTLSLFWLLINYLTFN